MQNKTGVLHRYCLCFKDFESELPEHLIMRVHKSYMVALNKINSVERDRIRIGSAFIPISETYKKDFLERIRQSI